MLSVSKNPAGTLARRDKVPSRLVGLAAISARLAARGYLTELYLSATMSAVSFPIVIVAVVATCVVLWLLALLRAILRARNGLHGLRGIRRRDRGLCPGCGYDLTGNASGICPECGATIGGS